ncbi:MAG: hypothetical protein MRZ39_08495 [Oscillospiraceae bacterium]|nr:hypothetical protein [Oscillospiraceae bacterium]
MNFKKIIASVAAAAVAVSTLAVSAFAATVTLNSEYTGGWSQSALIPKSEFEAIGGDVKVVLEVERHEPLIGDGNYLLKAMNAAESWDEITSQFTSDTAIRKGDGFIVVGKDVTSIEFVVPEATWQSFHGYINDGVEDETTSGLSFQVNDVIIKSAELSAGSPEGEFTVVDEATSADIMQNGVPAADTAADTTTEEAPAADTAATTATATGNTSAAVIVSVMAVAGAAAIAAKKRK